MRLNRQLSVNEVEWMYCGGCVAVGVSEWNIDMGVRELVMNALYTQLPATPSPVRVKSADKSLPLFTLRDCHWLIHSQASPISFPSQGRVHWNGESF